MLYCQMKSIRDRELHTDRSDSNPTGPQFMAGNELLQVPNYGGMKRKGSNPTGWGGPFFFNSKKIVHFYFFNFLK
jgi:hypothetical protein